MALGILAARLGLDRIEWVLLCFLLALALAAWSVRRFRRFRRSHVAKLALGAERAALQLLRSSGYTIVDTQVHQVWRVRHGAFNRDVNLRADVLVRRARRHFIAEVKSSALVADLKHGPTRRQLLEYAVAYGTDGVLLVDMHRQQIEEIVFPGLAPRTRRRSWSLFATCILAFAAGSWLAAHGFIPY